MVYIAFIVIAQEGGGGAIWASVVGSPNPGHKELPT
jgi:hypothetical protein